MERLQKLAYRELTLADRAWVTKKLREDGRALCEYTFAGNYAWSECYRLQLARTEECGIFRYADGENEIYSFPFGGSERHKRALLDAVMAECEGRDGELLLSPIADADRALLQRWYPGRFLIGGNRDFSDYIYEREKLVRLPGKKLHGKRSHIARFQDAHDWGYEPVTEENRADAGEMMERWKKARADAWNVELEQEFTAMRRALMHMEELGLCGGLLRKAGSVVALALGEPLNDDTFVVHFEKAFADVQGAYPMMNQQFALHAAEGYTYVNREEDTGDPGLRRAKMSYYPCKLEDKYTAIAGEVVFADPSDKAQTAAVCALWRRCFDDGAFAEFYMKERASSRNMLLIFREGKPVSMASFLPAVYQTAGGALPVRYAYAVATLPEYRGRGLAGKLLDCALRLWDEPLAVAPADEGLYRYYESRGFVRCFADGAGALPASEAGKSGWKLPPCNFHWEEADPAEYAALRDQYFSGKKSAFLSWDAEAVAFAFAVNAREGGKNKLLAADDGTHKKELLMYAAQGEELVIVETTLSGELLSRLLPELLAETGTKRARLESCGGMLRLPERLKAFALPADGYLGLTLC